MADYLFALCQLAFEFMTELSGTLQQVATRKKTFDEVLMEIFQNVQYPRRSTNCFHRVLKLISERKPRYSFFLTKYFNELSSLLVLNLKFIFSSQKFGLLRNIHQLWCDFLQ